MQSTASPQSRVAWPSGVDIVTPVKSSFLPHCSQTLDELSASRRPRLVPKTHHQEAWKMHICASSPEACLVSFRTVGLPTTFFSTQTTLCFRLKALFQGTGSVTCVFAFALCSMSCLPDPCFCLSLSPLICQCARSIHPHAKCGCLRVARENRHNRPEATSTSHLVQHVAGFFVSQVRFLQLRIAAAFHLTVRAKRFRVELSARPSRCQKSRIVPRSMSSQFARSSQLYGLW